MKDNFSHQSASYAKFRPEYPDDLVEFILSKCNSFNTAWDCATGNGQFAVKLAPHFKKIIATDLSAKQIEQATQLSNIKYSVEVAGESTFENNIFDLISVAQAIHWFNFEKFYAEVNRTLKKDGVFAVIGYGLLQVNKEIDDLIMDFYEGKLGEYWDPERKLIDEAYKSIPFPFHEISSPEFKMTFRWNRYQLIGFLNTWSAVQHYKTKTGKEAVDEDFISEIKKYWADEELKEISFPIFLRLGNKKSSYTL